MSIAQLTAKVVMNKAAALMNDPTRSTYTYAVQVPYLQTAMQELQEYFELHNVSVTKKTSTIIPVNAGVSEIGYDTPVKLPDDMVEPVELWESSRGLDSWTPMTKVRSISPNGSSINNFGGYLWENQKIKFRAANQNNDIKIEYICALFTEITDENSPINIVNARTYLEFRTAGLLSEFVENNEPNMSRNNNYASLAMDRATGITVKGKQNIMTRRRPFRSGYK